MNTDISNDLKEMFRKQAEPVDPDRLDTIRKRVLAGVPNEVPASAWFRRPALAFSSVLAVLLIAAGIYLFRDTSPPGPRDPLDDIYRIVENDDQLDQLVLLLDEFVSGESRTYLLEREEDLGTGVFTEDDLLPTTVEYLENGSSLL